jgi:hypothetical protein
MPAQHYPFSPQAGGGATLIFSYPTGFSGASSAINTVNDAAGFSGSVINLCNGTVGQHEGGAAWYKTRQNIASFTTTFTFEIGSTGTVPSIQGMTFIIQNNSAIEPSGDANICGYGVYSTQTSMANSMALKFDIGANSAAYKSFPPGSSSNKTGVYANGGPFQALIPESDLNPFGVNLNSGHVMSCTIVYDGSLLTMVLQDTSTGSQARLWWPIDIVGAVGSTSAYVGFCAGEIPAAQINLLTWSWWQGYSTRLEAPTFSPPPGQYSSAQTVTISGAAGSTIYYSTNGLPPTTSSTQYTGPITVGTNKIIQAVSVQSNFTDSYAAIGNYQIQSSSAPIINFPSGFSGASGLIIPCGYVKLSGQNILLTDTTLNFEVGAAWYAAPVNIQTFRTAFTIQCGSLSNTYNGNCGFTFCLQNPSSTTGTRAWASGGPLAVSNVFSGLGYSGSTGSLGQVAGILTSVALAFDCTVGTNGAVGVYANGAQPTGSDTNITGLNMNSGHPINVAVTYDGTTLSVTMTDTVTTGAFSHSWTVNIPSTVGANTAYVGFTAATGYSVVNQSLTAWTYSTP